MDDDDSENDNDAALAELVVEDMRAISQGVGGKKKAEEEEEEDNFFPPFPFAPPPSPTGGIRPRKTSIVSLPCGKKAVSLAAVTAVSPCGCPGFCPAAKKAASLFPASR